MPEKQIYNLSINEILKKLIPPLSFNEKKLLEENITKDGCREPICTWNNIIIDGHNRYEICTRLKIPFHTQQMAFSTQDEVIAWICANQLGRRNISEETRRYLIGKRYEAEKTFGSKNPSGKNQYAESDIEDADSQEPSISNQLTAKKLGSEYNVGERTVRQYGNYAKALDSLADQEPTFVSGILSGKVKISYKNVRKLIKDSKPVFKNIKKQISSNDNFVSYSKTRKAIPAKKDKVSIKDMPTYDPDAEISSLILTIPSWISSIDRTLAVANISKTTNQARVRLKKELNNLEYAVNVMLLAVEEK